MNCSSYVGNSVMCWEASGKIPKSTMEKLSFEELWNLHPKEHGQVMMMGKKIDVPRYQKVYLRDYVFSGMNHKAEDLPEQFEELKELAQELVDFCYSGPKKTINQCVINWYENGEHYIGAHRDNEKIIVEDSPIISISLGATRTFRIRDYKTKEIVNDIELKDGNYYIMGGEFQKHFTHEIVKINGKKAADIGKRINLTFRITN